MNSRAAAAVGFDVLQQGLIQAVDLRLVERIGWMLLQSVWQFAAVALLLMLCQRASVHLPARIRYLASCAALLVMVAVSMVTLTAIRLPERTAANSMEQSSPTPRSPSLANGPVFPLAVQGDAAVVPGRPGAPSAVKLSLAPAIPSKNSEAADTPPSARAAPLAWGERIIVVLEPYLSTIVVIWLVGVGLLSARPVAGWWHVRRLRRDGTSAVSPAVESLLQHAARRLGVRRAVGVLQSTLVKVPAVVGWLQPLVLLPVSVITGLSPRELEAVLAHELAHVCRHDYLVNLLQTLVETLFFYHPAVWWVSHTIREQREECCDDLALSVCGDTSLYAAALLAVERLRDANAAPVPALSAAGGSLLSRIRRIVGRPEKTAAIWSDSPLSAAAVLAAMFVIVLSLSGRSPPLENASAPRAAEKTRAAPSVMDLALLPQTEGKAADPPKVSLRLDGLLPAPKSIRVDLTLDREEFLLGESIVVDVEMTNVGMEPVPYERGGFYPDLRVNDGFRVSAVKVDAQGKPVAPPVARWPLPEDHGGPMGGFTLKPDESHTTTLFVTRYLRFLEPGRYRLRIENVDRGEQAVYAAGETFFTLKQPTLEQARGVYRAMKGAPRKAYDDNAMKFLRNAADFEAIYQPIYLTVLKERAEDGDIDAFSSLERMESPEANAALVAVLTRALDGDNWQLARAAYRRLKTSLPFPNWYDEPLNNYDKGHREKSARTWKPEFRTALTRLARRLNVEVAAKMRDREGQPADADANDREFMKLFRRGFFPDDHPQALLQDLDYIYRCVGQPEDFGDCLSAYARSIELTKSLPLETMQYMRPRGSAFGLGHTVFRLMQRGAAPPTRPTHPGEAAAFAMALRMQLTFRPAGWHAELMKWLRSDSAYLVELILDHLPQPVPDEVLEFLPTALAHEYVDLQIAACHVAKQHPRAAYRAPLEKILETATDEYLRKYAVDAARANGIKAKYDAHAPFVTPEEAAEDAPPKKDDDKRDGSAFRIPEDIVQRARDLAAASLSRRGGAQSRRPADLGDVDSPQAVERAVARALRDLETGGVNGTAIERLKYLGDAAFNAAAAGTKSDVTVVAQTCCSVLQHRGAKAVPALLAALKSTNANVRSAAAQALGQTFQPVAVPALIAALDDADGGVKVSTMFALLYLRDRRALEPLRRLTDDPGRGHVASLAIQHIEHPLGYAWWPPESLEHWQLCQDAHTLRGESYGQAELDRLVQHLASGNGDIPYMSLFALGALDARSSVPAIIAAPSSGMKIHVLAKLGTPEAVDHVVQNLHSRNPSTRGLALEGLGQGADRWGTPLLIALLDDPTLKVEERGGKAEDRLSRRGSLEYWPEWHKAHAALFQFLYRFGLPGRMINLANGQTNNVPEEISRLKAWWKEHGLAFLDGKAVPNPDLTTVMYNR